MEYKKVNNNYIVRIDKGEEVIEKIKELCNKESIKLGTITGIGATNNVEIGLFDINTKEYHSSKLTDIYEITSLIGNISTMNDETYLHIHINISDRNNNAYGGHLNKCYVSATVELFINVIDSQIDRKFNEEIGLNLIDLR